MKLSFKGFTLSELLLAVAILGFALSGILLVFTNCILLNAANRNLSISTSHAEYILEDIKAAGFTGLENRINNSDGTPTGWDLNASEIESTPYNLTALDNESISTSVFQSGNPLGVSVVVNWLDRGQKNRNIEALTLFSDY